MIDSTKQKPLRILMVSILHEYSNGYAFVRALRRAGHSVTVISPDNYLPLWQGKMMRGFRRLLSGEIHKEFNKALLFSAEKLKPDLFFACKGHMVFPETLDRIKGIGAIAINFYPDVSLYNHGPYLPKTISKYNHVFTTKPVHLKILEAEFNFTKATFVSHSYNPEVHSPFLLNDTDWEKYGCDVSFIGGPSRQKEQFLKYLISNLPNVNLKIWGPQSWSNLGPEVQAAYQGTTVVGREYAKAIIASNINLGLLHESVDNTGYGDVITSRTFHMPASGGFMLHKDTQEARKYFEEGKECAFYSDENDLVQKVEYYLENDQERKKIAQAGRERCLKSGYSVDDRVGLIVQKYYELARGH